MTSSVSVIIPTYNRRHLIDETLASIFKQSLPPAEIIVVDNLSTDGTIPYLRDTFKDKLITLTCEKKTPGAARNLGLSAATGKFIKFFDSDDLMTNNTLEVQVKSLTGSKKGFVYSPYFYASLEDDRTWKSDQVVLNYFPLPPHKPLWHFMMVDGLFITIPGMMFKRELLEEVGEWREDVIASEDWDYLFRISLHEPYPEHTNLCSFLYRLHAAQTTSANLSNQQRDFDKVIVLENLFNLLIKNDSRFSRLEKIAFVNKFYQTDRATPANHPLKKVVAPYNSMTNRIVWQIQRVRNKIGRMKTRTSWQPCHGAFESKDMVAKYLSLIS